MKLDLPEKYQGILEAVEVELSCSSHGPDHVERIYRLCLKLAAGEEGLDLEALKLAALLHDIARVREDRDETGTVDHAILGAELAGEILAAEGYPQEKIGLIKDCIRSHRLRGKREPASREGKLLSDADKLDILGAVGIGRLYMLAGQYGGPLYAEEGEGPCTPANLEFENALRAIPEKLYTEKARHLARERLKLMEGYFARLRAELGL